MCLLAGPAGAALAGLTAAGLGGLEGFSVPEVYLTVPVGSRKPRRDGLLVHYSSYLGPEDVHPAKEPPRTRMARSLVDAASWEVHERRARAIILAGVQQRRARPDDVRTPSPDGARAKHMPSVPSQSQMPTAVSPRCRNANSSRSGGDSGCPCQTGRPSYDGPAATTTSTCIGPRTRRGPRSTARSTFRYGRGTPTWTGTMSSPPEAGGSCSSRPTRFGTAKITSAPWSSGRYVRPAGTDLHPLAILRQSWRSHRRERLKIARCAADARSRPAGFPRPRRPRHLE